jgi:hypothetical protein
LFGAEDLVSDLVVADPAAVQARPDGLHERHRAAQVEVGVGAQRDDVGVDEALVRARASLACSYQTKVVQDVSREP